MFNSLHCCFIVFTNHVNTRCRLRRQKPCLICPSYPRQIFLRLASCIFHVDFPLATLDFVNTATHTLAPMCDCTWNVKSYRSGRSVYIVKPCFFLSFPISLYCFHGLAAIVVDPIVPLPFHCTVSREVCAYVRENTYNWDTII